MNTYIEGVRDAFSRMGRGRRSGSSFMSFMFGAGVGLVAGAAIAMLVTPSSGDEIRRELGTRAKKLAEKTQGALSDAKRTVQSKLGGESQEYGGREDYTGRNEVPMG